MQPTYSTREVARLLRMREDQVRAYARAGVAGQRPPDHEDAPFRFSFRDVATLKAAHRLVAGGIRQGHVLRALSTLRGRLPDNQPLSGLRLEASSRGVVARADGKAWEVNSGQYMLPLAQAASAAPAAAAQTTAAGPQTVAAVTNDDSVSADEWFQIASELEDHEPYQAYEAYLRALACNPEHLEALINVGRLCSAAGDLERAAAYFRQALRVDPTQPIAYFNLGVTLQDLGNAPAAIEAYRTVLLYDPNFADAHYNLANLLEQHGDARAALQHLAAYRRASESRE